MIVLSLQTSPCCQSDVVQLPGLNVPSTTSTRSSPEDRQPFPRYPPAPLLGHIFPPISSSSSSSSLLSSSLAYEMLASAALSSLRRASSSLLPSSSPYDVLSAAAVAAFLQPPAQSHPQLGAFSALDRDGVLDLVVAPTRGGSETTGSSVVEERGDDAEVKHSPAPEQSAAVPRPRCCPVWRPY